MIFFRIIFYIISLPFRFIIWLFVKLFRVVSLRIKRKKLKSLNYNKIDTLNGFEFERFISDVFNIYEFTTRVTQKTGDNGADIIASKFGRTYAIQTKLYYEHSVGNKAVQEVYTAKSFYKTDYAVVVCNSKFSKSAIDMAQVLKVILIDKIDLENIIKKGLRDKYYSLDRYLLKFC